MLVEEYLRIENLCKKQKHIADDDNLNVIISEDEQTLEELGITFKQLEDFFEKLMYHFSKGNEILLTNDQIEKINSLGIGSPQWYLSKKKIVSIFNDELIVIKITWGGAEPCPFQSLDDKKYYGYEYGSHDWIFINSITNDVLHVGDLLFHQIVKHHFFQGKNSKYRVDPLRLITFFNLETGIDYSSDFVEKKKWVVTSNQLYNNIISSKVYTINDCSMKEYFADLFYEKINDHNIVYYDDSCALFIVNDPSELPSKLIGYEYDKKIFNNNYSGYVTFNLCSLKEISEKEQRINWMNLKEGHILKLKCFD